MPQKSSPFPPRYPWFPNGRGAASRRLLSPRPTQAWLTQFLAQYKAYKEHQEQKLISYLSLRRHVLKSVQGERLAD